MLYCTSPTMRCDFLLFGFRRLPSAESFGARPRLVFFFFFSAESGDFVDFFPARAMMKHKRAARTTNKEMMPTLNARGSEITQHQVDQLK